MTVTNWNRTASAEPAREVTPESLDELIGIVRDKFTKRGVALPCPSPVRAVGSLHSLNACFTTTGTLVHMKAEPFRTIGKPANGSVTVGAGVTMVELAKALAPDGLQIAVTPEIGNATAGSVACCGTKDASLRGGPGQISSTVTGVKMVDARGDLHEVSDATDPGLMRAIRSSYGLLGIIVEVTFETCPLQTVRYASEALPLAGLTLDQALGGADGFLGFLFPYNDALVVERRTLVERGDRQRLGVAPRPLDLLKGAGDLAKQPFDVTKRKVRNLVWKTGGHPFSENPEAFARQFRDLFPLLSFESDRVDVIIDFSEDADDLIAHLKRLFPFLDVPGGPGGDHFFDFAFWAFPAASWGRAVPDYVEFCREFRARTGFRPALPTEVYRISRDTRALLSFSSTSDIVTLDMVHMLHLAPGQEQDHALWRQMNVEFNEKIAVPHGARPLLNQTKALSRAVVDATLGDDWKALKALRDAHDPARRFVNQYFADLL